MPLDEAVFLDRDGTLIEEVNYLSRAEQVRLIAGAADAVRRVNEAGARVVVVTNQAGVARGYFPEDRVAEIHAHLSAPFLRHELWVGQWLHYRDWDGIKKERQHKFFPANAAGDIVGGLVAEQFIEHVRFNNGLGPQHFRKPPAAPGRGQDGMARSPASPPAAGDLSRRLKGLACWSDPAAKHSNGAPAHGRRGLPALGSCKSAAMR